MPRHFLTSLRSLRNVLFTTVACLIKILSVSNLKEAIQATWSISKVENTMNQFCEQGCHVDKEP